MDIHRCRFVEHPPSTINALSFSPALNVKEQDDQARLAVGRGNGNIEIWNPLNGIWHHETTLQGGKDRSIEGLAWIHRWEQVREEHGHISGTPRLFSIGCSTVVTEWDLVNGLPIRQSSGNFSEIWCIAAQPPLKDLEPRSKNESQAKEEGRHQRLAVGCADGSVILLSTRDDRLEFERYLARVSEKKARALCMVWKSRNVLAVGYADSTIRVYSAASQRKDPHVRTITLGGGRRGVQKEKLVWALACLPDGTLISGDSTGATCWWDRENYGALQKIQAHEADVLCLSASADGKTIFSGGIDLKTVIYMRSTDQSSASARWSKSSHQRTHTKDVKAMASFESRNLSIVASGGPDAQLTITPLAKHREEYHRRLPGVPQKPPVTGARRLVLNWWNNQVNIWRVRGRKDSQSPASDVADRKEYDLVAQMAIKGDENVATAGLSPDGNLLAVSTVAETKMFRLRWKRAGEERQLKITKLSTSADLSQSGARILKFSPDSKWLVKITESNEPIVYPIDTSSEKSSDARPGRGLKLKRLQRPLQHGPWRQYSRHIVCASFSARSNVLATADIAGHVDVWQHQPMLNVKDERLEDEESSSDEDAGANQAHNQDAIQPWYHTPARDAPPQLSSIPIDISFCPPRTISNRSGLPLVNGVVDDDRTPKNGSEDGTMVVITASNEIFEFAALEGRLTPWSRRNPPATLPPELRLQRDCAMGCFWDIQQHAGERKKRMWVYGATWLCMVDMTQDLPFRDKSSSQQPHPGTVSRSTEKKRKRKQETLVEEALRSKRRVAGAGSKKKAEEAGETAKELTDGTRRSSTSNQLKAVNGNENRRHLDVGESQSEEDGSGEDTALVQRRRMSDAQPRPSGTNGANDGQAEDAFNGASVPQQAEQGSLTEGKGAPPYHMVTRYRPILGVIPLSNNEEESGKVLVNGDHQRRRQLGLPEIAIVEMPEYQ